MFTFISFLYYVEEEKIRYLLLLPFTTILDFIFSPAVIIVLAFNNITKKISED